MKFEIIDLVNVSLLAALNMSILSSVFDVKSDLSKQYAFFLFQLHMRFWLHILHLVLRQNGKLGRVPLAYALRLLAK